MCRKLETEQEKVLPFYSSSLTEEEEQQLNQAEQEEPSERLAKVSLFCSFGQPAMALDNYRKKTEAQDSSRSSNNKLGYVTAILALFCT